VGIWYAYTVPAIILENRGVLDGMSSSKKFARKKKWGTILIMAIPAGVTLMGNLVQNGIFHFAGNGASVAGIVRVEVMGGTELVFGAISGVLWSVMLSYTYLFYAMRSTTEQQQSSV